MAANSVADRAQRREAFLGSILLLLFGCGVLAFLVSKDRVDWLTADHARAAVADAADHVDDDLGEEVEELTEKASR